MTIGAAIDAAQKETIRSGWESDITQHDSEAHASGHTDHTDPADNRAEKTISGEPHNSHLQLAALLANKNAIHSAQTNNMDATSRITALQSLEPGVFILTKSLTVCSVCVCRSSIFRPSPRHLPKIE